MFLDMQNFAFRERLRISREMIFLICFYCALPLRLRRGDRFSRSDIKLQEIDMWGIDGSMDGRRVPDNDTRLTTANNKNNRL